MRAVWLTGRRGNSGWTHMARLVTAVAAAACNDEKSSVQQPTPPTGMIAGVVASSAGGSGVPSSSIVLRRSGGDSLKASMSDASGAFRFETLEAGSYVVAARIPSGFRAVTASDTNIIVSLPAGGSATVRFVATPITEITDTVLAGGTDTLTLATGARVIVSAPSAHYRLRSASLPHPRTRLSGGADWLVLPLR